MAMSEACPRARERGVWSMMLPLGREYRWPLVPLPWWGLNVGWYGWDVIEGSTAREAVLCLSYNQ